MLTDNLNGTFITFNGNELSLQNDMGNTHTTYLSKGFYPIGMTEYGGITYIVSISEDSTLEIGSFPSLPNNDWNLDIASTNISEPIDFTYEYRPLYNLIRNEALHPFRTTKLSGYDIQHPVTIEVQPSYDGSVNLILTDNKNPVRMINTGFAVLESGKGKFINRHQDVKTNYYIEDTLEQTSKLINATTAFVTIDLGSDTSEGVEPGGQLKGGNYTFYLKLGDEDGNLTDIVAESGIVSIFNGTIGTPSTIYGAFHNELTDKLVNLTISGLDTGYSRIYVYYSREYCDLNGVRATETYSIVEPIPIKGEEQVITISGLETVAPISMEELNIAYYNINSAKTATQQQNMLFLGNVEMSEPDAEELQKISWGIKVGTK